MDHIDFYNAGRKMALGGHAAGLMPEGLTLAQSRDWRDGYMDGCIARRGREPNSPEFISMRK